MHQLSIFIASCIDYSADIAPYYYTININRAYTKSIYKKRELYRIVRNTAFSSNSIIIAPRETSTYRKYNNTTLSYVRLRDVYSEPGVIMSIGIGKKIYLGYDNINSTHKMALTLYTG